MVAAVERKFVIDQLALYANDHQVGAGGKGEKSGVRAGQRGNLPEADGAADAKVTATSA
jgi:hypothetical protein